VAYLNLGDVYVKLDKKAEARRAYENTWNWRRPGGVPIPRASSCAGYERLVPCSDGDAGPAGVKSGTIKKKTSLAHARSMAHPPAALHRVAFGHHAGRAAPGGGKPGLRRSAAACPAG